MELDAEVPTMFEVMLTSAMESKGTDWDMLAALLKACAEESVLQVGGRPALIASCSCRVGWLGNGHASSGGEPLL